MTVRMAEKKDTPELIKLMISLLNSVRIFSPDAPFTKDPEKTVRGLYEYLEASMNINNRIIFVGEDTGGVPAGLLVGVIRYLPGFYDPDILGEVEAIYPLSFASAPLVKAFDSWAIRCGAKARSGYSGHQLAAKVFLRDGMSLSNGFFLKKYEGA